MKKLPSLCFRASFLVAITTTAWSSPLVYESFTYGIGNGATMNGVTSTGTGLTGAYAVANTNTASTTYSTTGLSFGSNFFPTTGGGVQVSSTFAGTQGVSITGVQLNTGTQTGTLYSSYLVNFSSVPSAPGTPRGGAVVLHRINTGATSGGASSAFVSAADAAEVELGLGRPGVGYDGALATTSATGFNFSLNTTYLVLSEFINVGTSLSGGSPGVATLWMMTQANYDSWRMTGGSLRANLTTYASATASTSVTSGTFTFSSSKYFQFGTASGSVISGTETAILDEMRWGTTLASVAVPEPSAAMLLVPGVLVLLCMRRRVRSSRQGVVFRRLC